MNAFLLQVILFSVIFVTPLVVALGPLEYEGAKVAYFLLAITSSLVFWILSKRQNNLIDLKNPITMAFAGLVLILGATSLTGISLKDSFFGRESYYQGWIVYLYGFCLYLFVAKLKIKPNIWIIGLLASSVIVSVFAIKEALQLYVFGLTIPNYAGRVVSTFGQPNFYSGFLVMSLPLIYWLGLKAAGRLKLLVWLSLLVISLAIVLSLSKIANALLLVLAFIWLLSKLKPFQRILLVLLTVIVLTGTVMLSLYYQVGFVWKELDQPTKIDYYNYQFPDRGFYFWQFGWSNNPEKRIYIWPVVGEIILKKPINGYGMENLIKVFPTAKLASLHGIKDLGVDRSHNFILDLLVFSGIGGLLFWVILLVLLWVKSKSAIFKLSLFIYIIWSFFQNQSIVNLIYFWLLAGMIDQ